MCFVSVEFLISLNGEVWGGGLHDPYLNYMFSHKGLEIGRFEKRRNELW